MKLYYEQFQSSKNSGEKDKIKVKMSCWWLHLDEEFILSYFVVPFHPEVTWLCIRNDKIFVNENVKLKLFVPLPIRLQCKIPDTFHKHPISIPFLPFSFFFCPNSHSGTFSLFLLRLLYHNPCHFVIIHSAQPSQACLTNPIFFSSKSCLSASGLALHYHHHKGQGETKIRLWFHTIRFMGDWLTMQSDRPRPIEFRVELSGRNFSSSATSLFLSLSSSLHSTPLHLHLLFHK